MRKLTVMAGCLLALVVLCQSALAQDTMGQTGTEVTGKLWLRSSEQEKQSFLIGAGSIVALEYRIREKKAEEPTRFIKGWVETLKGMSWKELSDKIDAYYMKHEDAQGRGVFDVLWHEIIKPSMKE